MPPDDKNDSDRTLVVGRTSPVFHRVAGEAIDACLVVIYGADLGRRIPLGPKPVDVGRLGECDVPIDQESVSRRHARIAWNGRGYRVADLGSTNGTYVNDVLVVAERDLHDGDLVKIGRTILKFMSGNNIEASYHEEIYRMMTFDGLTGIFNRRYFSEAIEREISRSKRYKRDLSLLLFDIDHFKQKNDTYGHVAGDAILVQLATAVKGRIRREDILARVGGEEFAVVLPEIAYPGAREAAEKVRRVVEQATFRFEDVVVPTTISVGVAQWTPPEEETENLYRRADEALYAAKQGGRNRVA